MRVHLLYFGVLKDVLAGAPAEWDLPQGETVAGMLRLLEKSASNESKVWSALAVAVNREYARPDTVLRDGDEVALLPPVSGGNLRRIST